MKTKLNLLLTALLALFCCTAADAQSLIYSNNFSLGGVGNIAGTAPTVANATLGGSGTATWNDVVGVNDTGFLQANGVDNTTATTSWLLPFVPQIGHVYLLTGVLTFTNNPGNWVGIGFARSNNVNVPLGNGRFSDAGVGPDGFDWLILTEGTGNIQYFAGGNSANNLFNQNNAFPPGPGTETVQILLDTQTPTTLWQVTSYINGNQMGSGFTYATNTVVSPTLTLGIAGVGLTQTAVSQPNDVQWNTFSLATTLAPYIVNQPTTQTASGGLSYTNKVAVMADTNGGTLFYQWYAGGLPLTNGLFSGSTISGANTNVLVINQITPAYQLTNYFVIVTNGFGSYTSTLASVTVLTNPVITLPKSPTNYLTLFGATAVSGTNYVGSSPFFQVEAIGAPTLFYSWLTNGVVVGGATNSSIQFTNLPAGGPTTFVCIVSNSYGPVSNSWIATYTSTPLSPYPQSVLASQSLDFWRLNEADDGLNDGNPGAISHDYSSGNNGIYTNTFLGNTGYNAAEPSETAARFGKFGQQFSYIGQIQNLDYGVANGVNAQFTVEAWVNISADDGAPAVSQGNVFTNESFYLGQDTNSAGNCFQFGVRNAAGAWFKADSSASADDGNWHHIVGVCDEANTNLTLYVDGRVAASTSITTKTGFWETNAPIAIGAGSLIGFGFTREFGGFIDDVSIYHQALSAGQVISQYSSFGNTVPVSFVSPPGTNGSYLANQTLTIPSIAAGSGPVGYYWTNLTTSTVIASGQISTNGSLNTALSIPNASSSMSGQQVELIVTNAVSSTNSVVITLFAVPSPILVDQTSPILYSNIFNGGTYPLAGTVPTVVNILEGGTNTIWVDELGTNDPSGTLMASGIPVVGTQDSWVLPFTPHAGYVYTFTTSVTFNGNPGTWVGPGFAQLVQTNGIDGRFNGGSVGYDWMILTESSGNVQYFAGSGGNGGITNKTPAFTAGVGTHTVTMTLDTTASNWKVYAFVDTTALGTNIYSTTPPIGAVGITQNSISPASVVQWNSFALTQVAPGGVVPYTLAPLPTSITLLANSPLSIPATNFGSAPFGYYWSNSATASILGSGVSSTMTPLTATLNIGSVPSSWSGGSLALVMTNAFGSNISRIALTVTNIVIVPTNSPTITGLSIAGANATINGANGDSGATYYLLGTTNLLKPLNQWLPMATNVLGTTSGSTNGFTFIGTNVFNLNIPQQFYILSGTN